MRWKCALTCPSIEHCELKLAVRNASKQKSGIDSPRGPGTPQKITRAFGRSLFPILNGHLKGSELERIRDEAGNLSQRYQDEVRERKNKTQQNGRLAERIFKAENALKGQDEMRSELERLRHVNLDKESEVSALRQRISRLESEMATQRAQSGRGNARTIAPQDQSPSYTVHSEGVQFIEQPTRIQLFCQELCDTLRSFLPGRNQSLT